MAVKIYRTDDVLNAARERIAMLFDNFEIINVSVSSGKDSCVLYHLALQEAIKRDRKITVFFLDQEAEYQASIDVIHILMQHPNVIPAWYQVPIYLTNATSYTDFFLHAWGHGEQWMREKDSLAIHEISEDYPHRFYGFFEWYEALNPDAAYLVGLRAEESITRYRAVTKHPGWNGINWASSTGGTHKFYPIYDWSVYDVWKYIYEFSIPYNRIYDLMYMSGVSIYKGMRVSNLIHEKAFGCLVDLPRFEPDTYDRLCRRIGGIATAARYASEKLVFSNKELPRHYKTWFEFRDFLLNNIPEADHRERFERRFAGQPEDERMYQQQVGQLLINDYEGSCAVDTKAAERARKTREKWYALL